MMYYFWLGKESEFYHGILKEDARDYVKAVTATEIKELAGIVYDRWRADFWKETGF